ncbi:hypothetical protein K431DRAFT_169716 [Polychaeton citri CBS 116435]|uniref:Uncharacterized protein n=1 Tax=Polychaeton citri CBS 116435 TaxID=1314669 RepID=A0A9P4PXN7_9PEZI|nr:hypothetical protein K431DRAFT_169716 [Polychaeton citri CBS 116435]
MHSMGDARNSRHGRSHIIVVGCTVRRYCGLQWRITRTRVPVSHHLQLMCGSMRWRSMGCCGLPWGLLRRHDSRGSTSAAISVIVGVVAGARLAGRQPAGDRELVSSVLSLASTWDRLSELCNGKKAKACPSEQGSRSGLGLSLGLGREREGNGREGQVRIKVGSGCRVITSHLTRGHCEAPHALVTTLGSLNIRNRPRSPLRSRVLPLPSLCPGAHLYPQPSNATAKADPEHREPERESIALPPLLPLPCVYLPTWVADKLRPYLHNLRHP